MKNIEVVAAIIKDGDKILATKRNYGELNGFWEFPGGKIEPGENHQQALSREISEEMHAKINVGDFLLTTEHDYSTFHLTMHCYYCELQDGEDIDLTVHSDAKWLTSEELDKLEWCPADVAVVEALK